MDTHHLHQTKIEAEIRSCLALVPGWTVLCRVMFAFYQLGSVWPLLVTLPTH